MPAYDEEKKQAVDEGLTIHEQEVVKNIKTNNNSLQLDIHQAQNNNGQISPGTFSRTIATDFVIAALGQESDLAFENYETITKAGDFDHGAASVAEALASGRRAAAATLEKLEITSALSLDNSLKNPAVVEYQQLHLDYYAKKPAISVSELNSKIRIENFSEIRQSLNLEQIKSEIERCFHCGSCTTCGICWFFCPDVAIAIDREESNPDESILFDYDHCKGCGQCAAICPRGVIEMEEDN